MESTAFEDPLNDGTQSPVTRSSSAARTRVHEQRRQSERRDGECNKAVSTTDVCKRRTFEVVAKPPDERRDDRVPMRKPERAMLVSGRNDVPPSRQETGSTDGGRQMPSGPRKMAQANGRRSSDWRRRSETDWHRETAAPIEARSALHRRDEGSTRSFDLVLSLAGGRAKRESGETPELTRSGMSDTSSPRHWVSGKSRRPKARVRRPAKSSVKAVYTTSLANGDIASGLRLATHLLPCAVRRRTARRDACR